MSGKNARIGTGKLRMMIEKDGDDLKVHPIHFANFNTAGYFFDEILDVGYSSIPDEVVALINDHGYCEIVIDLKELELEYYHPEEDPLLVIPTCEIIPMPIEEIEIPF